MGLSGFFLLFLFLGRSFFEWEWGVYFLGGGGVEGVLIKVFSVGVLLFACLLIRLSLFDSLFL